MEEQSGEPSGATPAPEPAQISLSLGGWAWVPPENGSIQRKGKTKRYALGGRHTNPTLATPIATVTKEESLQGNCSLGYGCH